MRGGAKCITFYAAELEALLVEEILEVVSPAGIEAAQRAAEHLAGHHQEQRQLFVDRLESAREVEARTAREYKQTDVTYTAVRQALGAEWEGALARVAEAESTWRLLTNSKPSCRRLPKSSSSRSWARMSGDCGTIRVHRTN